jgi:hypothetical protein
MRNFSGPHSVCRLKEAADRPIRTRVRRLLALTAYVLLFALAPGAAKAATVAVEGDALRVTALPGEQNVVWVAPGATPGTLTVSDVGAPPTS